MNKTKTEDLVDFGPKKGGGMNEKTEGICYFCDELCDQENYCFGCKQFICGQCDKRGLDMPFANHDVEEHKETK